MDTWRVGSVATLRSRIPAHSFQQGLRYLGSEIFRGSYASPSRLSPAVLGTHDDWYQSRCCNPSCFVTRSLDFHHGLIRVRRIWDHSLINTIITSSPAFVSVTVALTSPISLFSLRLLE